MNDVSDVGVVFTYWVQPGKEAQSEETMAQIFGAMGEEEFPTGDVKLYTDYWDPSRPGTRVMLEHFTPAGSSSHATGPKMGQIGRDFTGLMAKPFTRVLLEPIRTYGFGEAGAGAEERDVKTDVAILADLQGNYGSDAEIEEVLGEIFDTMAEEEFSTGNVKAYAMYRDPSLVARYVMYGHYNEAGAAQHATGPLMREVAAKLQPLMMLTDSMRLKPVIFAGVGEPISQTRS